MGRLKGLDRAQKKLESLMIDTCQIRRDLELTGDDAVDPVTLKLVRPNLDDLPFYEGKCLLKPEGSYSQEDVGGETKAKRSSEILLPLSSPALELGDRVTMLACARVPANVGTEFIVTDIERGSFEVAQRVDLARK